MWQVQFNCLLNVKNKIKYPTTVNNIYYNDFIINKSLQSLCAIQPHRLDYKPFFSISRIIFSTQQIRYICILDRDRPKLEQLDICTEINWVRFLRFFRLKSKWDPSWVFFKKEIEII